MVKTILCKGGCGNKSVYAGWCGIKWKIGNRVCIKCPKIEEIRGNSISKYRLKEAKLGLNPMQNPNVCKKNHSKERNKKCSTTLKKLGALRLLPQQTEPKESREKRLKNVSKALKRLSREGRFPTQIESKEKRRLRSKKISRTLKSLARVGKLPIQNMSEEQKNKFGKKISKILRKKIKDGKIKLNSWGKIYKYKGKIRTIKLRSKWERDVAKFLDKYNFNWDYEYVAVPYYDTEKRLIRNTIPDFYIKNLNCFIEVKGNGEFRSQNTQDKLKGVRARGYKIILFGKHQIKLIKEDPQKIIERLKV